MAEDVAKELKNVSTTNARVLARQPTVETSRAQFANDVAYYLSLGPRQLPSRYLYDELGSALFDAICQLPWYGLTRAETALLTKHAREVFTALDPLTRIVELGSGSGEKLARLLTAGRGRLSPLDLHLVDVSKLALETASSALSAFEGVRVVTHQAPYEAGLEEVSRESFSGGRSLLLFLGSNIGNFDPPGADAMLRLIRATLAPGDGFLVGADLMKPERDLLLAYDDPLGVTAAFNRNLLVRINRELGADFDLGGFTHRAVWNQEASRIEMHLVSTRSQYVRVPAAHIEFAMNEGETIWTESSYKYRRDDLMAMLDRNGFGRPRQWIEPTAQFALTLVDAQ
jgi:dimethylhistidine N-methyltransferase